MTLEIIGAGFGRTGTDSLKRALEMLGYGPCYHMYEVLPHEDRMEMWREILGGRRAPDWDRVFDGFRATVDWPSARYWRVLAVHFPKAKILLSHRDPDSWYRSMDKTILGKARDPLHANSMAAHVCQSVFGDRAPSRAHAIATYERNIAEVQAAFGEDRLLNYELGSGWVPLCRFLGVDLPPVPYPRGNDSKEYHARGRELAGPPAAGAVDGQNGLAN